MISLLLNMRIRLCLIFLTVFVSQVSSAGVAFRSSSNSTYSTRTNNTLTAPAGIQNGDLLVILFFVGINGTPPAATPPAGFSAISGFPVVITSTGFSVRSYGWYKIASGESGNYTVTVSSSDNQGFIAAFSGVDTGSPFSPTPTIQSGTGLTATATGNTTPRDDSLVMYWHQDWADTTNSLTGPSGATPTFTRRLTNGVLYVATGVLATAGATGNKSVTTNNNNATHPWQASLLIIQPPPACAIQTTADSYQLPIGGACWTVTGPNAVCKYLRNNSPTGKDVLVPAKTTAEWTAFYGNLPSGVTADTCP